MEDRRDACPTGREAKKEEKDMYIVICGGGKVGAYLVGTLKASGHNVVIIERNREKCEKIAEKHSDVLVINGDACDVRYLEDAGIERADVVAAVTGDDDDNLVVCQLAKESFHVPRTVARVNNPKNEHIFKELGVNGAISSTTIISKLIEEESSIGDIITLQALRKGKLALVEVELPTDRCVVCNKKVKDLGLPSDCVLVSIIRGDEVIIPRGSTMLEAGDGVIALTSIEKENLLRDIMLGRS
ncbi:MAG: TrkA family potassium uptake protein [Actinobacteria bacterium]|nr:TrkA family potassium uptake protein [Actinomycetota bacterium]